MARIPEVPLEPEDPLARELFQKNVEEHGFVLNTSRIYAHRPTLMRGHAELSRGVGESGLLADSLKALVCVRVAGINGCPF